MILRPDVQSGLWRLALTTLIVSVALAFPGCSKLVSVRQLDIRVLVQDAFQQVYASSAPITLTASLQNDPTNEGVTWTLSVANTNCSPGCGKIAKSPTDPKFSAVYTPPANPPVNTTATITAASAANNAVVYAFNFTITPPISVSIPNKFTTQKSGDPAIALNATVTNDLANAGVTWTLAAGGQPCSPSCGTLTSPASPTFTATYTPPATVPAGPTASPEITATSVTDPTKSDSINFTIVPGITVSITDKFSREVIGGPSVVVNATVTADAANAGVTWTLLNANGQPCSNCGTLLAAPSPSFAATYTPPTTQPLGADSTPIITATSVSNPTKSDSFSFLISIPTTAFAGSYAFSLRGYDLTGSPLALAGSVTLDTSGNITNGEMDINNGGGITFLSQISGNFIPDSSFNGIVRLTLNILNGATSGNANAGPLTTPLSFKAVLSADLTHGRILELDGIGFVNVGTIQRQDAAALAAANPAGTYAFGVDSDSPIGGRTVEAGQLILSSGGVTGGLIDESKAGDPAPRYTAVPLAASNLTAPDSSGRGTLELHVNAKNVPVSLDHYAYYVVNSGQLLLIQIDASPTFGTVFSGIARAQKPLNANSVLTTSVIQLTGMDTVPGTTSQIGPDVIIGVMTISAVPGAANDAFQLAFDENDLGKTFISKTINGAITFDPSTGRGTISDPGGFGTSFMDAAVFYLNDVGAGFVIDADPSTCVPGGVCPPPNNYPITNNAFSGTLIPQVPGPFFDPNNPNQFLSGNLTFSSGASANIYIPSIVAGLTLNTSTSMYSAAGDLTSQDPPVGDGNLPNVTFNGTYGIQSATTGHGFIRLPQQIFGEFIGNQLFQAWFYLIGPNQFVAIGTGNGSSPSNSGVLFFDPQ